MSYLLGEIQHLKRHWFSCLLSCVVVHLAFEAAEALLTHLWAVDWANVIRVVMGTKI